MDELSFALKTINDFLKELAVIDNVNEKMIKLNDFVNKLEKELNKVEAFKRELPLCMLLLNDLIRCLKDELDQYMTSNSRPKRLEELALLKKEDGEEDSSDKVVNECVDKRSWIRSLKLSSGDNYDTSDLICNLNGNAKLETKGYDQPVAESFFKTCKELSAGTSIPFKTLPGLPTSENRKKENGELPLSGLSLLIPDTENRELSCYIGSNTRSRRAANSYMETVQSRTEQEQPLQQARKHRRCWSPELHRRFVDALQQLGGAQVATPKQIRELMQVDGLTNDEVKSHLQKYRLHIRRLPSGLAMSQNTYGDPSKSVVPHSGSPQGPLQLVVNSGGTSTTGDSMEDNEDEKSDSYSWKSRIYNPGKDDI